ncbi:MAG: Outer membrane lipoprotein Omp16 [Alphaproteobacteria bacterium MarineAlpha9_Bin3]|nr:MAG: Outer membrane lipoprotein Omp16 [Alphaproteobacteria bacterium MarineAlpha9_Bin3]|tara:strand:- start:3211 stop:3771 length:561 start_codon:yes stop_codon:yes gene_type:complete
MLEYFKIFIISILLLTFISCTNKDQESLLLDAEGGNTEQNDTLTEEIEITDNIAQAIEIEEVELTVEEKLASELIEVGDRIFFGYDESTITDESAATLQQQYQFLIRNPDLSITVTGHCDERGTREYNLALGERRASAAKNYLISLGISSNRISVISYGKEKPSVEGHDETAWTQNRTAITFINNN